MERTSITLHSLHRAQTIVVTATTYIRLKEQLELEELGFSLELDLNSIYFASFLGIPRVKAQFLVPCR